jgi:hypothetical protein
MSDGVDGLKQFVAPLTMTAADNKTMLKRIIVDVHNAIKIIEVCLCAVVVCVCVALLLCHGSYCFQNREDFEAAIQNVCSRYVQQVCACVCVRVARCICLCVCECVVKFVLGCGTCVCVVCVSVSYMSHMPRSLPHISRRLTMVMLKQITIDNFSSKNAELNHSSPMYETTCCCGCLCVVGVSLCVVKAVCCCDCLCGARV